MLVLLDMSEPGVALKPVFATVLVAMLVLLELDKVQVRLEQVLDVG